MVTLTSSWFTGRVLVVRLLPQMFLVFHPAILEPSFDLISHLVIFQLKFSTQFPTRKFLAHNVIVLSLALTFSGWVLVVFPYLSFREIQSLRQLHPLRSREISLGLETE